MNLGIFLSKCEGIVGTAIDLEALAGEYQDAHVVKIIESFYYPRDFDDMLETVSAKKLDGLVLAGDSPLKYSQVRNGDYLLKSFSKKGVNTNRIGLVNLKNMVAMPHDASQSELQLKARLLIDVAIEKVRHSANVEMLEVAPRKAVAVIGGDIGAVAVSQHLLDEGYKVFLIHDGTDIPLSSETSPYMHPTLVYVMRHPRFRALYETTVKDLNGFPGDYSLRLISGGQRQEIGIGAAVLSLGGDRRLLRRYQTLFRLDLEDDGGLAPRDPVSARSLTQDRGIFLVDHDRTDPDSLPRKLAAADAAASMVINLLNRKEIFHRVMVSQVDRDLCSGCGACVKTCIFNAVSLKGDPAISVIDPRRCRGCGNCVAACPADARDLIVYPSGYLFRAVDILSGYRPASGGERMLLIACEGCGYRCIDQAGEEGQTWPAGVLPLKVVCGGQVDTQLIMHAFVRGFEFVVLMVCAEGACHNIIGNVELERRMNLFREILTSRGIDPGRLHIIQVPRSGSVCVDRINEIYHSRKVNF